MVRLLFLGDITGNLACDIVCKNIAAIKQRHKIDFIIANVENVTDGIGLSCKDFSDLRATCIDCFTTGNHSFDVKDDIEIYNEFPNLLRPDNYPKHMPGRGFYRGKIAGLPIIVLNLMGQEYIDPILNNPFTLMEKFLRKNYLERFFIFLDFHAASAIEKLTMAHYLAGKISAMAGTHTHVQTNDAQIMRGTGYITDAGMCGDETGIVGMNPQEPIFRYLNKGLTHEPISGVKDSEFITLNGVIYDLNPETKLCDRVQIFKERIKAK